MTDSPNDAVSVFRVAIEFVLRGDLRYLSHHDEMLMVQRALRRADWPLRFSQGFNPIPKLTFPLPRAVGVGSNCERVLTELSEPRDADALFVSLRRCMPPQAPLQGLWAPVGKRTPQATAIEYAAQLDAGLPKQTVEQVRSFLAEESTLITRDHGPSKPTTEVDVRPFVERIEIENDRRSLRLRLRVDRQRSARPNEILSAIGLSASAEDWLITRDCIEWDFSFDNPACQSRTNIEEMKRGNQEEDC